MLAIVPKPKASPAEPTLVQTNLRLPPALIEHLDSWVEELNQGRSWPKMTRSDLIRGVLAWAAKERPDWEGK
jgi:hypothetical protein